MPELNQRKRRHQRFDLYWEALLEVETSEFQKLMPVPLVNISQSGVLLYTDSMTCNNYHIVVAGQNDQLNLIINTPAKALDSKIAVRRYSWDGNRKAFAVGAEFKEKSGEGKAFTEWLMKNISRWHQQQVLIPDECMMNL